MRNSDRFIDLYNQLDRHLRDFTGLTDRHGNSFSGVLREAAKRDATVRRYERRIRGFADLRNAIVHEGRYGEEPIAEPHAQVVDEFELYVDRITQPRRLDSVGSNVNRIFAPTDPLTDVLRYLREGDYSQAVVWSEIEGTRLVSSEGIARWLEMHADLGIVEIGGVPIEVLLAEEPEGTFRVLSRNRVIADVQELFEDHTDTPGRLSAILVTQNGRATEKPIRIITPWDLLAFE